MKVKTKCVNNAFIEPCVAVMGMNKLCWIKIVFFQKDTVQVPSMEIQCVFLFTWKLCSGGMWVKQ